MIWLMLLKDICCYEYSLWGISLDAVAITQTRYNGSLDHGSGSKSESVYILHMQLIMPQYLYVKLETERSQGCNRDGEELIEGHQEFIQFWT